MAKAGLRRFHKQNAVIKDTLPHEHIIVRINGKKATGDIGPPLRDEISRTSMRQFLSFKGILPIHIFDRIDWDAIKHKMHNTKQQHRIWITKHLSGFCATNKMLQKRNPHQDPKCPCCKITIEDTRHQLHCLDPERKELWDDSVDELRKWLTEVDTEPNLNYSITTYIRDKGHTNFSDTIDQQGELQNIANIIDIIGWDNFIEGKIPIELRVKQHEYYTEIESRKTGMTWASDLISKLLLLIHTQWIYRNDIVHKRARDGLKLAESAETNKEITAQFNLGPDSLLGEDEHLLEHTKNETSEWSGIKKKIWIRTIKLARNLKRKRQEEDTGKAKQSSTRQKTDNLVQPPTGTTQTTQRKRKRTQSSGDRKKVRKK